MNYWKQLSLVPAFLCAGLGIDTSSARADDRTVSSPYGNAATAILIGSVSSNRVRIITQRLSDGACNTRTYSTSTDDVITVLASPKADRVRVVGWEETPTLCGKTVGDVDDLPSVDIRVEGRAGNDFMFGAASEFIGGDGNDIIVNTLDSHYYHAGGAGDDLYIEYAYGGWSWGLFQGGTGNDIMCGMHRRGPPMRGALGEGGTDSVGGNYTDEVEAENLWPESNNTCHEQTAIAVWAAVVYFGG